MSDKEFEKILNESMEELDGTLRKLTEIEAEEKKDQEELAKTYGEDFKASKVYLRDNKTGDIVWEGDPILKKDMKWDSRKEED